MRYILLFLLTLGFTHLLAQPQQDSTSVQSRGWHEFGEVDYRVPSSEVIEKYAQDDDYQYEIEKNNIKPPSWIAQFFSAIARFLEWLFKPAEYVVGKTPNFVYWILLVAIVGIVAFLLLRFFKVPFLFSKKQEQPTSAEIIADDIYSETLEDQLNQYIDQKAYKQAVRVLFLLTLRTFNSSGLIDWQSFKTNRDYIYEINSPEKKSQFRQMAMVYEYVWYGHFEPDEQLFAECQTLYNQINR